MKHRKYLIATVGYSAALAAGVVLSQSESAVDLFKTATNSSFGHIKSSLALLHPWISTPLMWGASPFLAAASMARATNGEKSDRLAFCALALAAFLFFVENLVVAHASRIVDSNTLIQFRLLLSALSNTLQCALPLLFVVRIESSARFLRDNWNVLVQLLVSAGIIVALGRATELMTTFTTGTAGDEIVSTAAAIMAGAALTGWARRYGLVPMMAMGACAAAFAIPQYDYWEGNVLMLDLMRIGEIGAGLILTMLPLSGPAEGLGVPVDKAKPHPIGLGRKLVA
jgi:hypothetical protein